MYDRQCSACEHTLTDRLEPIAAPEVPCPACGAPTGRVWLSRASAVIADEIPGGVLVHHGICHEDGTPRRYYSKSEMAAEARRRGLTNVVRHVGAHGSDKSTQTTRWV
jgi:hypothetical protein